MALVAEIVADGLSEEENVWTEVTHYSADQKNLTVT
jgi:hypothetical protein